jgi:hypothetical protein
MKEGSTSPILSCPRKRGIQYSLWDAHHIKLTARDYWIVHPARTMTGKAT